jgi:hypothetical protein
MTQSLLGTTIFIAAMAVAVAADATKLKAPSGSGKVTGGTPTVATLTVSECTQLGGTVHKESYGLCSTGKFCGTVDQKGKTHRVCITKQ